MHTIDSTGAVRPMRFATAIVAAIGVAIAGWAVPPAAAIDDRWDGLLGEGEQYRPPEATIEWQRISTSANLDLRNPDAPPNRSAALSGQLHLTADEWEAERILSMRPVQLTAVVPRGADGSMDLDADADRTQRWLGGHALQHQFRHARQLRAHHHGTPTISVNTRLPTHRPLPDGFDRIAGHLELLVIREASIHRLELDKLDLDAGPITLAPGVVLELEELAAEAGRLRMRGALHSRRPFFLPRFVEPDEDEPDLETWRGPHPIRLWVVDDTGNRQTSSQWIHEGHRPRLDEEGWHRHRIGRTSSWSDEREPVALELLMLERVAIERIEWEIEDVVLPRFDE